MATQRLSCGWQVTHCRGRAMPGRPLQPCRRAPQPHRCSGSCTRCAIWCLHTAHLRATSSTASPAFPCPSSCGRWQHQKQSRPQICWTSWRRGRRRRLSPALRPPCLGPGMRDRVVGIFDCPTQSICNAGHGTAFCFSPLPGWLEMSISPPAQQ